MTYLYLGIDNRQLRYFTSEEQKVPTPAEAAHLEHQRAEQQRQRADLLAERLRQLGVNPDEI